MFLEFEPKCLNFDSRYKQDALMSAVNESNLPMVRFILEANQSVNLSKQDDWGFACLTYAIKNNFLTGFYYLLAKEAPLRKNLVDSNGCSFAHWAAFADRRLILGLLFRAGFDFHAKNINNKTPFELAVDNWSIFSMNFLMDYSLRPLKTHFFLEGSTKFHKLDLLSEQLTVPDNQVQSHYVPKRLKWLSRIRKGVFKSVGNLLSDNCGTAIVDFVKYRWYKDNIKYNYWFRCYLFLVATMVSHWLTLFFCPEDVAESEDKIPTSSQFSILYIIALFLSGLTSVFLAFRLGTL